MDLNQNQSDSHDQIEEEEDELPIDFKSSAQVWFFYKIDSCPVHSIIFFFAIIGQSDWKTKRLAVILRIFLWKINNMTFLVFLVA